MSSHRSLPSSLCALSTVFRVADLSKRGLVSFEDFTVFETLLKVRYVSFPPLLLLLLSCSNDSAHARKRAREADSTRLEIDPLTDRSTTVRFDSIQRPDADHKIAFTYFDVDGSGTISFDEFKSTFSANIASVV